MRISPTTRWVLTVLALALLTRLGVFFLCVHGDRSRVLTLDTQSYHRPALNLLEHGVFSNYDLSNGISEPAGPAYLAHGGVKRIVATKGPFLPDAFRTPGYPFFLAAVYTVFSQDPLAVVFLQCLLGASTCAIVCLMGAVVGSPRGGFLGGLFLALDPGSVLDCNLVVTETVYTWLLCAALLSLLAALYRQSVPLLVLAGLLAGSSILCRPGGAYLPLVVALGILASAWKPWRARLGYAMLFLLCALVPLAPWLWRNYSLFGVWQISSIQGLNLFFCKAADLESNSLGDQEQANVAIQQLEQEIRPAIEERPRNQLEMANLYQEYAIRHIRRQPGAYLKLHALGTVKLLLSPNVDELYSLNEWPYQRSGLFSMILEGPKGHGTDQSMQKRDYFALTLALAETLWLVALYALALAGILTSGRAQWRGYLLLLVLVGLYTIAIAGSQGSARFRLPAMPVIVLLAGLGVERLRRLKSSYQSAERAAPFLVSRSA